MVVFLFKLLFLLTIFGLMFSFLPKFVYKQVKSLLVYHRYRKESFKTRLPKVLRVYAFLGLTLGAVLLFLMSPVFSLENGDLSSSLIFIDNIDLVLLSFVVSFSLVIILRVSTLLSKSKIYARVTSGKARRKILEDSYKYDYRGMKEEIESFLFSIFLSALLGSMVFFFYKMIFDPFSIISFSFTGTFLSLSGYVSVVLFFIISLVLITALGELLLEWGGIRPQCEVSFKD